MDTRIDLAIALQEARTVDEVASIAVQTTAGTSSFVVSRSDGTHQILWSQMPDLTASQVTAFGLSQSSQTGLSWPLVAYGVPFGHWIHHGSPPESDVADWARRLVGSALHRVMVSEGLLSERNDAEIRLDQMLCVSEAVASLDPQTVLNTCLKTAVSITGADVGYAVASPPSGASLTSDWGLGPVIESIRLKAGLSLPEAMESGHRLRLRTAFAVREAIADTEMRDNLDSLWMEPIEYNGVPLGSVVVVNVDHEDTSVAEQLAAVLRLGATSLQNALLHQQILEQQKLEEQLKVAGEIQQGLLPPPAGRIRRLAFAASAVPCDACGGDYYDYFELDDDRTAFVLGDATGHGVPAAIMVTAAQAAIRAVLENTSDLRSACKKLNRIFNRDFVEDRFITLVILIHRDSTGEVHYVNAGHVPPLLVYRKQADRVEEGRTTGPPLGMLPEISYGVESIEPLAAGDRLVLLTDGVHEARHPESGMFGLERTKALIKAHAAKPPGAFVDIVQSDIQAFMSPASRSDDTTVLCIQAEADE